ncbi:MAG: alpha/beta fold hydrolase [Campylobacterota bacterium]|nr:alpha/beta fold hydrolase [Campylobacterota bacterium]
MAIKRIDYFDKLFDINYEILNNSKENTIVFLHGWGSNKEVMKNAFSDGLKDFRHIYIDMPGFGKSETNHILTTKDYANIIEIFLNQLLRNNSIDTITIAGHSFGGKVATYLEPKNLILLSTAGILELKSQKTLLTIRMAKIFNKFGLAKVTQMLRSNDVENMSQNMYETFKNVVDEDFSEVFAKYKKNTLIFWGETDTATTLGSGKTIHKLIKNSFFRSYDGDHYFFMKYADDICDIITDKIK